MLQHVQRRAGVRSGTTGGLLYTTGAGDSRAFNLHNLKFSVRLIKGQYKSGIEVL
jgi:hypothetical protein